MTERERNVELRDGLRAQGMPAELFPDQARGVTKPYDLVACAPGGVYWAIECKLVHIPSWSSQQTLLCTRSFRPHQLPGLLKVVEGGGRASVVLFVTPPRTAETRAWLISALWAANRFAHGEVLRLDRLLGEEFFELQRLPRVGWGLAPALLEKMHTTLRRGTDPHSSF